MKLIMLLYAIQLVKTPYIWGGNSPLSGLDCSGMVIAVLSSVGLQPPHDMTSQQLYGYFNGGNHGYERSDKISAGCLLFFGADDKHIKHVSIALDEDHMVEASGGSSRVKTLEDAIKYNAFVKISPVKRRDDLIAILMLQ